MTPTTSHTTAADQALVLEALSVGLVSGEPIVQSVDLVLPPGQILGLVGESGSGKTTTALALLGYTEPGVTVTAGRLRIGDTGVDMNETMRRKRGSLISYVPQNPGRSLNPSLRVVDAIEDVLQAHGKSVARGHSAVLELLGRVGLDTSVSFGRRYPHQLSGGQQQRVCIATSLSCDPAIIVLDEPTTGLDVISQAKILDELTRLRDEHKVSMLYVTHDLAVVAQVADQIAVMYAGRIVEQGPTHQVLRNPRHPYTRGLLASTPDHVRPRVLEPIPGIAAGVGERSVGCSFAPRCPQVTAECRTDVPELVECQPGRQVRCLHWQATPPLTIIAPASADVVHAVGLAAQPLLEVRQLRAEHRSRGEVSIAAADISFAIEAGSCVALVGESGSGKTTIARAVAGLHPIAGGQILLAGEGLAGNVRKRSIEQRRRVQIVFQNPAEALNPRHSVRDTIARPAQVLRGCSRKAALREVDELLDRVRLPASLAGRYPNELSGGERQRVAIARALAAHPEVILCDEVTSALDVSVQAAVLELLNDLRADSRISMLFISHDLGTVGAIADRILVLQNGQVVESGATATILSSPQHPYTQSLLESAPSVATVTGPRRENVISLPTSIHGSYP